MSQKSFKASNIPITVCLTKSDTRNTSVKGFLTTSMVSLASPFPSFSSSPSEVNTAEEWLHIIAVNITCEITVWKSSSRPCRRNLKNVNLGNSMDAQIRLANEMNIHVVSSALLIKIYCCSVALFAALYQSAKREEAQM